MEVGQDTKVHECISDLSIRLVSRSSPRSHVREGCEILYESGQPFLDAVEIDAAVCSQSCPILGQDAA